MADNQNENPELKTIAEIKKESEKIFKQGRDKIRGKIGEVKAAYRDKPYSFNVNSVEEELMKPLRKTYDEKRAKMSAVEKGMMTTGEKIRELANLKVELRAEIETGYENAIALIAEQTEGETEMTREALAKMAVYAPLLTKLAESKKGKPLTEIFKEMTILTSLGGDHEKILTDAILDPELERLAFFVLTMARKNVQDEFTEKFIAKYPEKGTWLLEKGNQCGCYDPTQIKKYLLLLKEKPEAQADAEQELQDFDKYEQVYAGRFNSGQMFKKRAEGLYAKDASNYALNHLTFKGVGRLIGYMSSSLTIAANLVANRKEYMKDPSLMAKNVYLWGAVGGMAWLVRTGQGKRVGDMLTTQATKETTGNKKKLKEFYEYMAENLKWEEFFYNRDEGIGGSQLLVEYSAHLKNQGKIAKYVPTVEGFLAFCKQKEDEGHVDKDKRASLKLESMIQGNRDRTQKELGRYITIFEDLKIGNKGDFKQTVDNAKEV